MQHHSPTEYGIYLHMPWCASRCPYCAFYKEVDPAPDYDRWLRGIERDQAHWAPCFSGMVHSIYFGGGTPSLAPPRVIAAALAGLPQTDGTEITVEVNPGSIDLAGLASLCALGVNRLSLGVQSLQPSQARFLSRGHSARQARELLQLMPELSLKSWSADLIFALPDQRPEELEADIQALVAADTPHISVYGLSIEPGTAFADLAAQGRLQLPDEDTWSHLYGLLRDRLSSAGYEQYEVSNFALPGHRSVHNESVWRGGHYMGLGPSAHGFAPSGHRWQNLADLERWLTQAPPMGELPSPREAATDYLLSTLRHLQGTHLDHLEACSGMRPSPATVTELCSHGLLRLDGQTLRIPPSSFALADGITRKLCDDLEPIPTRVTIDSRISGR